MKGAVFVLSLEALDMKAFVKAVKKILSHVTDEMLELLFLKVDTDCNGLVTWVRRAPPLPQVAGGRLEGPSQRDTGRRWFVDRKAPQLRTWVPVEAGKGRSGSTWRRGRKPRTHLFCTSGLQSCSQDFCVVPRPLKRGLRARPGLGTHSPEWSSPVVRTCQVPFCPNQLLHRGIQFPG